MSYKRVLLKLSGEALMGDKAFGICPEVIKYVALEVQRAHRENIQVALVIGAGNIFRGISGAAIGMDRATADNMGMLGTVINSLAMQDALSHIGVPTRVMSAIPMQSVCESYVHRRAVRHLEKGRVVILGAGTGNPYFSTDTAGVLRALEVDAEVVMKATKVDGVYDRDPVKDMAAVRFDKLSYDRVLKLNLRVMDGPAISLARDEQLPILVFNLKKAGNIVAAATGQGVGTLITN